MADPDMEQVATKRDEPKFYRSMSGGCEWNPAMSAPAIDTDEHYLSMQASVLVGAKGQWRLCAYCALLPAFRKYRVRKEIRRPVSPARIARVWLWLAHLHDLQAGDFHYAWPPDEDDAVIEEEEHLMSEACGKRADTVCPGATGRLWGDAIATFEDANLWS